MFEEQHDVKQKNREFKLKTNEKLLKDEINNLKCSCSNPDISSHIVLSYYSVNRKRKRYEELSRKKFQEWLSHWTCRSTCAGRTPSRNISKFAKSMLVKREMINSPHTVKLRLRNIKGAIAMIHCSDEDKNSSEASFIEIEKSLDIRRRTFGRI